MCRLLGFRACCRCCGVLGVVRGLSFPVRSQGDPVASAARGLAAPFAGSGREAGGGTALVFFLPAVPCGTDALVADDEQAGEGDHEGRQSGEAAPAAIFGQPEPS